jgi:hypothetical protein
MRALRLVGIGVVSMSVRGTKRTCKPRRQMSALRGITDMRRT